MFCSALPPVLGRPIIKSYSVEKRVKRLFAILLTVLFAGCGGVPVYNLIISFPDEQAKAQTTTVEVLLIIPQAGSFCGALLEGTVSPGSPGYEVEQSLSLDYPSGTGTLHQVGSGRRLFYAFGRDQAQKKILHGCTDTAMSEASEIEIKLLWVCRPTNGGVETCDGVDNDCNGTRDDGDPVFLCPAVPRARAIACADGVCNYQCDKGWANPNSSWSDGCECQISRGGVEWCDGVDNDCDGQTDGSACTKCSQDADCQEPTECLDGRCTDSVCSYSQVPAGQPCDDGLFCTVDDACDSNGLCQGKDRTCPQPPPCQRSFCKESEQACITEPLEDGMPCPDDGLFCNGSESCSQGRCVSSGDPCPGPDGDENCAESCNEEAQDCSLPDPAASACNDGILCTLEDYCDGSGSCLSGNASDEQCPPGEFCLPGCSSSSSGCLRVDNFALSCAQSTGDLLLCRLDSGGIPGLAPCLQCQAELVEPILSWVDFEADNQPGTCSLEGWSIEQEPVCSRRSQVCPLQMNPLNPTCCVTPACPVRSEPLSGRTALEFGKTACSEESMRLYRLVDLRAFERAQFCLDIGHLGGASPYKYVQLQASPEEVFFCQRANASPALPANGLGRLCASVPARAFSSSTRLDVWLQTDIGSWIIDNLWLQAGYNNCQRTTREIFRESFDTCSGDLPTSWNGWTITANGTRPSCQTVACSPPNLLVQSGTISLERRLDTQELSQVWLCWNAAVASISSGNVFSVEFDDGTGWRTAYQVEGAIVAGQLLSCQRNCVDLSRLSQTAAGNPSLGLRFSATVLDGAFVLDDITVQGPDTCAAGNRLTLEPIVEDERNPGTYHVTVTNQARKNFSVLLECQLGQEGPRASTSFQFQVN